MSEFKADLKKDSKKVRSSIQYDIKRLENTLTMYLSATNKLTNFSELKSKLGLEGPISDLHEFYEFDKKVKLDKDLAITLVCLLYFFLLFYHSNNTISFFLARIYKFENEN